MGGGGGERTLAVFRITYTTSKTKAKQTPTNKRKAQNRGPKTHYNATTQQQKATGAAASTQQQKATAARILI
jgi:hypothetical protein